MLGVAMMFSGIIDIVIFASGHDYMAGSGWFLADGILTVLMSLFILGNGWFTAMTISFILGMWLIFSGITKLVHSFDLQKLGVKGWFTVLGILLTVIGFLSFTHPFASIAAMAWVIGFFLLLQGIVSVMRGYFSNRF
ncbi:HdeD family acid-resistance protein [Bariatricus sp. HCP28S3_C2]